MVSRTVGVHRKKVALLGKRWGKLWSDRKGNAGQTVDPGSQRRPIRAEPRRKGMGCSGLVGKGRNANNGRYDG